MRNLTATICLTLAILLGSGGVSWSVDLQKGLEAYKNKDYATALHELKPLAEQGHAFAQTNLGVMYAKGQGVIQDNVHAQMWGNLGASNGNTIGGKLRDMVARKMTPSQLEKAQDLAHECVRKKYKGC